VRSLDDIATRGSIENMMFENTDPTATVFHNHSGYGKWYMREWYDAGRIQLGEGRHDLPQQAAHDRIRDAIQNPGKPERVPMPVLIGLREDGTTLYADYDNINPGFTTFWVRAAKLQK